MKITYCSPKGGVGKSTASLLFASVLAKAGHHVALRDLDPDGTTTKSAPRFGLTVSNETASLIITDTPPSIAHTQTQRSIAEADLVVNVLTLDPAAIEKLPGAVPTLLNLRSGRPIVTLINRLPRANTHAAKTLPSVRKLLAETGLPALNSTLGDRMGYAYSHSAGLDALDTTSKAEVMAFAMECLRFAIRV